MADTCLEFAGLKLDNPLILASGVLGTTKGSLMQAAGAGAGAVTIKSVSVEPRAGHNNPIVCDTGHGILNAVGYGNMGVENAMQEFTSLEDVCCPVIASIIGEKTSEFTELAETVCTGEFHALELPLSCPHTPGVGMLAGHGTSEATFDITMAVREVCTLPLIVKLSPNTPEIGEVATAALSAGADAINMGNTLGPGMQINVRARSPVLDFGFGGMSGPAVKPVTIRCVYDIYEATKGKIPIIATGGMTYGEDVAEAFMAGATAVGVGTAIYYRGIEAFQLIRAELEGLLEELDAESLTEIVGVAHGQD